MKKYGDLGSDDGNYVIDLLSDDESDSEPDVKCAINPSLDSVVDIGVRNYVIDLLSDDESDSEPDVECAINPSLDSVVDIGVQKCWACEKISEDEKVENRIHPLLQLHCCNECIKELLAVEDDVQAIIRLKDRAKSTKRKRRKYEDNSSDDSSSYHEMEMCSGCAGIVQDKNNEDYDLLLCDSCPRAFCLRCVSLAHYDGDIEAAWSIAVAFCDSKSAFWNCIFCKPTRGLLNKQLSMRNVVLPLKPNNIQAIVNNLLETIDDESVSDEIYPRRKRNVNIKCGMQNAMYTDNEILNNESLENESDIPESGMHQNMDNETDYDGKCIIRDRLLVGIEETVNDRTGKCFACEIELDQKLITGSDDESDKKTTYLYSTHVHPILRLPCCSSCANELLAVERDAQSISQKKEENADLAERESPNDAFSTSSETEICSGCAGHALDEQDEEYELLLCDNCPRAFCKRCVALAHGEETVSAWLIVDELVRSKDPWKCIYCEPTPELTRLQLPIPNLDLEKDFQHDTSNFDRDLQEKDTEKLLNDLLALENKYEEAELMLEETSIHNQRSLILQEIRESSDGKISMEEIEENVKVELAAWIDLWKTHHTRLAENIGIVHDILCCPEHDVDLGAFYRYINKDLIIGRELHATTASVEKEEQDPSWKREADKALSERDRRSGYATGVFIGASGYKGKEESYVDFDELLESNVDIEEINSMEDTINIQEAIVNRNGAATMLQQWGSTSFSERDIHQFKKALTVEDCELKDRRVRLSLKTVKVDLQKESASVRKQFCFSGSLRQMVFREYNECAEEGNPTLRERTNHGLTAREIRSRSAVSQRKPNRRRVPPENISPIHEMNSQRKSVDNVLSLAFQESPIILGKLGSVSISVAKPIADALKSHQISGIRFMYDNICSDLHSTAKTDVNGCILAHCMGLGKTLQTIALLHCLLTHPALVEFGDSDGNGQVVKNQRFINRILVIVPVNVLVNWQNEIEKWVDGQAVPKIRTYNLNTMPKNDAARDDAIKKTWLDTGGILFASGQTLLRFVKPSIDNKDEFPDRHAAFFSPGADVIVLDEAHLFLKSDRTAISKMLSMMETRRRISLTGTPFANNLMEYYHMVNWVKPGFLGPSTDFELGFVTPILNSLNADATANVIKKGDRLLTELAMKLSSFINRAGSDILLHDLKFIQQAVIHVRQSKTQAKLYRAFQIYKESIGNNNFLFAYRNLSPVNNHPACLLETETHAKSKGETLLEEVIELNGESDDIDTDVDHRASRNDVSLTEKKDEYWWQDVHSSTPGFSNIDNGTKVLVLLNILAYAEMIGDKVLLFSQCLKTLDFLEKVLQTEDWTSYAPSINSLSPGRRWGAWKKNTDYLRIDGSTSSAERGSLVDQFSSRDKSDNDFKLFLISSRAGGIGINLVSANRVILYDSNFNPAIDVQAVFRCYRYGQTKPVFVYRLLTEGTLEEKVYSRSVNKTSLFLRAVDQKHPERNFTASELANMLQNDTWVQCDSCDKWRMLPPEADAANLPEKWYCQMNTLDADRSTCDAPEEEKGFYDAFYASRHHHHDGGESPPSSEAFVIEESSVSRGDDDDEKLEFTKRDVILSHLVNFFSKEKGDGVKKKGRKPVKSSHGLISKYYFHDSLFRDQTSIPSQSQNTIEDGASPRK